MADARYPSLYEINTRVHVADIGRTLGRAATLDDIPDSELAEIARLGFDWVWLLGVWQTGAEGRELSRTHEGLRWEFQGLLPDLQDDDICGSCFAITGYTTHDSLGGDAALARLRERMRAHGLRLMLDFVPNHTAADHPWVAEHPDFYVAGTEDDLERAPHNYHRVTRGADSRILAYGRDPYFDGWGDTLQLNYGNPALQDAMRAELRKIAGQCDGVRCDMAMLLLPQVFLGTWDIEIEPFWPETVAQVLAEHPDFTLLAEVYWDLEWELQQQGFAYTYDKRMYDRLLKQQALPVRGHLLADPEFQRKSARFLENHDESRAAAAFPFEVHQAAAILTYLTPGLRFFHEGQFDGRRRVVPVHLCRGPSEVANPDIQAFYARLLTCLREPAVRDGRWRLLECSPAWEGNWTWECFIAFAWEGPEGNQLLVAVNYAPNQSQCYVHLPADKTGDRTLRFHDLTSAASYIRGDLASGGLYLDMPAWGYHVFEVTPAHPH